MLSYSNSVHLEVNHRHLNSCQRLPLGYRWPGPMTDSIMVVKRWFGLRTIVSQCLIRSRLGSSWCAWTCARVIIWRTRPPCSNWHRCWPDQSKLRSSWASVDRVASPSWLHFLSKLLLPSVFGLAPTKSCLGAGVALPRPGLPTIAVKSMHLRPNLHSLLPEEG